MKNDQDYFSEYFTLCEFFLQKRAILEKLWERVRKSTCEGEYWKDLGELKRFDAFLREEEVIFWRDVENARKNGAKFFFDDFSHENELGLFEKKAVLFLLYTNLFHPVCGWQVNELVAMVDTEPSWDSKLRFHKALCAESPLFKRNILILKPRTSGSHHDADIVLNPAMRSALVEFMSGKNIEIPTAGKDDPLQETGNLREPEYGMDDVVLPQKIKDDVLFHIDSWKGGMGDLGIEEKIKKGRGAAFLFYGPPGTGKSMLADAIARHLGKKILQVAMPQITDKLFGETEKNIANLFTTAKARNAVICFDEADSLLYSRQRMEHERDIAFVNVMLQEIERFEGVLCLTTNFDTALDPALERRVSLKIKFTPPDQALRPGIWRAHIPSKVTIAADVDFNELGQKFVMSGGYIKNAVMNALRRLAQEKRTSITMEDLLFGARMEQDGMFLKENKQPMGFAGRV
ncbi:MAG: AAA family ATPase [Candidatus Omnitrophica bacterium]|nr:AAA family ATPase [Candidatus Omnitrophota bacterium]